MERQTPDREAVTCCLHTKRLNLIHSASSPCKYSLQKAQYRITNLNLTPWWPIPLSYTLAVYTIFLLVCVLLSQARERWLGLFKVARPPPAQPVRPISSGTLRCQNGKSHRAQRYTRRLASMAL